VKQDGIPQTVLIDRLKGSRSDQFAHDGGGMPAPLTLFIKALARNPYNWLVSAFLFECLSSVITCLPPA
jgi:hypothetical protein